MTNYTCIGIGTTDENGIAHITHDCEGNPLPEPGYPGSGAGETLIIASLDNPVNVESILSNILNIIDEDSYKLTLTADKSIIQTGEVATLSATLTNNNIGVVNKTVNFLKKEEVCRDGGITGDSSAEYWAWNSTYVSQSVDATGTTVTNSDVSDRVYTLRKATSGTDYEVFSRFCSFEFDLVSVTGTVQIQQRIGTTQKVYNLTETGHYKIVNDDEYINIYCDNVLKDRLENTMTGLHQIRFGMFGVASFTYKNFKVFDGEIFATGTTDSNGVATVSYTGQGTGHLNIKADCMNLIEPCSLWDTLFYDSGLSDHRTDWTNTNDRMDVTYESEGTFLICNNQESNGIFVANYTLPNQCIIEFDMIRYTGANIRIELKGHQLYVTSTRLNDENWHKLKAILSNGNVDWYIDDVFITSSTTTSSTNARFIVQVGASMKFRNFKIYNL